jgi:acetyl-CoA acetyltransferase
MSCSGVAPRVMGIGPLYAIPMVLKNTGITQDDVDLFEVRLNLAAETFLTFARSTKHSHHNVFIV